MIRFWNQWNEKKNDLRVEFNKHEMLRDYFLI